MLDVMFIVVNSIGLGLSIIVSILSVCQSVHLSISHKSLYTQLLIPFKNEFLKTLHAFLLLYVESHNVTKHSTYRSYLVLVVCFHFSIIIGGAGNGDIIFFWKYQCVGRTFNSFQVYQYFTIYITDGTFFLKLNNFHK